MPNSEAGGMYDRSLQGYDEVLEQGADNPLAVETDPEDLRSRIENAESLFDLVSVNWEITDAALDQSLPQSEALQLKDALHAKRAELYAKEHTRNLSRLNEAQTIRDLRNIRAEIDSTSRNEQHSDNASGEITEAFESRLAFLRKENTSRLLQEFEELPPSYAIGVYIEAQNAHNEGEIDDGGLQLCKEAYEFQVQKHKEQTAQAHIALIHETNQISALESIENQINYDAFQGTLAKEAKTACEQALVSRLSDLQREQYGILLQQIEDIPDPDELYAVLHEIRTVHCPYGKKYTNINEDLAKALIRRIYEIQEAASVPIER